MPDEVSANVDAKQTISDPIGFVDVDGASDPKYFVDLLASRSTTPQWRARIRLVTELLELQPGHQVLEVGCGIGAEVRTFASEVGPNGRVVGVDSSETMIAEARKRTEGLDLPAEFRVGDVYHLEFEENSFDCCFASNLFLHLDHPERALAELVRVVQPGGRVLVSEQDGETWVVDHPDRLLTRRIANAKVDRARNSWIGRQLPRLFREAGLTDISVTPSTFTVTDEHSPLPLGSVARRAAHLAAEERVITAAEAAAWLKDFDEAVVAGTYFAAQTSFLVTGRKP